MKDAYYFPHDSNAQHDEKIVELRCEYGWEGYGIYWALVERMRDAEGYKLRSDKTKSLAMVLGISTDKLTGIIDLCFSVELFESDDEYYFSPSLLRRMEKVDAKRDQAKRAAEARWGSERNADALQTDSGRNATGNANKSKVKEIKPNENKGDKNKEMITSIVGFLNLTTNSNYKPSSANTVKHINARISEGYTYDDFKAVVSFKWKEWKGRPDMVQYLRPDTLFGTKMEAYLNAAKNPLAKQTGSDSVQPKRAPKKTHYSAQELDYYRKMGKTPPPLN